MLKAQSDHNTAAAFYGTATHIFISCVLLIASVEGTKALVCEPHKYEGIFFALFCTLYLTNVRENENVQLFLPIFHFFPSRDVKP